MMEPLTAAVFENHLVWNTLGGYLGLRELKGCRLVCKTFDKGVRGLKRWKNGRQVHLEDTVWSEPDLPAALEGSSGISAVKVTLTDSSPLVTQQIVEALKKGVLQNVKTITLQLAKYQDVKRWNRTDFAPTVSAILLHCSPELSTLRLHDDILALCGLPSIADDCAERFRGLRTLEVIQPYGRNGAWVTVGPSLQAFAAKLDSVEALTLPPHPYINVQTEGILLKEVVEKRHHVLKKLDLAGNDALMKIPDLPLPSLTHLSLRLLSQTGLVPHWRIKERLRDFLETLPPLEDLTLKIQGPLSRLLLATIEGKSENLSSLNLKCWGLQHSLSWEWLKTLENLKSFSLTTPSSNYGEGSGRTSPPVFIEDLLHSLPEKGMRSVRLRSGVLVGSPLTSRFELEQVLRLPKFSGLEELSLLLRDSCAVRDPVLEVLASRERFPYLRTLHLSDTHHHSGELVGDRAFWAGLRELSIRKTTGFLREESLLEKLSDSKELRHLTFGDIPTLSKAGVERIADSNKSLESLTSDRVSYVEEGRLVRDVQEPRPVYRRDDEDSDAEFDRGYEDRRPRGRRVAWVENWDE